MVVIRRILRVDNVVQRYHIHDLTKFKEKYRYDSRQRIHKRRVDRIEPPPPPPPEGVFRIQFSVRFSYIRGTRHDYYIDINGFISSDTTDRRSLKRQIAREVQDHYADTDRSWALSNADKIDVVIASIERVDRSFPTKTEVIKLQRL